MSQQNRNPAQAAPNALSEFKLRLTAPPQQGSTKKAALSMGVWKNNPRLIVRTNVPNDKDYGKITAALNTFTFMALLHLLDKIADGPNDVKEVLNNNSDFVAGRKYDAPITVSKVMLGKSKEGVIWIAVTAKDRPMIKFEFQSDEWHFLSHADGTNWTESESSVLYTHAWTNTARALVPLILKEEYMAPEFNDNRGGQQGGGGNNWGGGNRGGGQQGGQSQGGQSRSASATDVEDENLPF